MCKHNMNPAIFIKICTFPIILFFAISCNYPKEYIHDTEVEEEQYCGIEIFVSSRTIYINDQMEASLFTILPSGEKISTDNDKVSWMSSDSYIIEIDDSGLINALREGNAYIIATMGDFVTSEEISIGDYSKILLSEVFYDPLGSDSGEFIEIYNGNECYCDISSFSLADGTELNELFTFPEGSLFPPNSFIVVSDSLEGFYQVFGFYPNFSSLPYSLENDGETVYLLKPDGSDNDCVYIEGGSNDYPVIESWASLDDPVADEGCSVQRKNFEDSDTYLDWEDGEPTPENSLNFFLDLP